MEGGTARLPDSRAVLVSKEVNIMPFDIPHMISRLVAAAAIPASMLGAADWLLDGPAEIPFPVAQTVAVSGRVAYPLPGEFLRDGRPVAAPRRLEEIAAFEIMTYQVSVLDYRRCVDAGACRPADAAPGQALRTPATGVSHLDAEAYAAWYSQATGERWRLPSAAEWALAAGERFSGDDLPVVADADNPAERWLSAYRAESARERTPVAEPQPRGAFGANAHGVYDLAGNVWEWTSTCYVRSTLAVGGREIATAVENCGVHVLEGRHRAYMSNFIRDGKSGGCAVGVPPDNLGFRLVREPRGETFVARLRDAVRGLFR